MKKWMMALLPLFLLVSCGNQGSEHAESAIAALYREAASIRMEATIVAEFSDRSADYRVAYTGSKDQSGVITVLAPASIAGVKATIGDDGSTLQFADTILETGVTNEDDVTPMSALPKLQKIWSMGDAGEIGAEKRDGKDTWLLVYREGNMEYRTWFLKENLCPVYAEVFHDDRAILRISYEKCEM